VFSCDDRRGREIVLYEDTWYDYNLDEHVEMEVGLAIAVARLRGITREEAVAVATQARNRVPQGAAVTRLLERLIA
jgi:VIT1/CCC1 family predicted Fe2+/Mn2+ transporter